MKELDQYLEKLYRQEKYLGYCVKSEIVKIARNMIKDFDTITSFINPITNELMKYGEAMFIVRWGLYLSKAGQKIANLEKEKTTIPADLKHKGDKK